MHVGCVTTGLLEKRRDCRNPIFRPNFLEIMTVSGSFVSWQHYSERLFAAGLSTSNCKSDIPANSPRNRNTISGLPQQHFTGTTIRGRTVPRKAHAVPHTIAHAPAPKRHPSSVKILLFYRIATVPAQRYGRIFLQQSPYR